MLQTIRDRAQGWIAWVIVILITIPFALWGIQEYLGGGAAPVKVSINKRDITEREFEESYRDYQNRLSNRMGAAYRPDQMDENELRAQVLENLITAELVLEAVDRIGLRAGDDMVRQYVRQIPAFQVGGKFSQEVFDSKVRQRGLSPEEFIAQFRQDVLKNQLALGIANSALVAEGELAERVRLERQQRAFEYLEIPVRDFLPAVTVEPAEVEAYYQSHQSEFMSPEQVKLEYVELNIGDIAKTLEADDETLRDYYEQYKSDYMTPEQRRVSHILIRVVDSADATAVDAARSRAEAALQRVRNGESFAAVAKQVSEDPLSNSIGGDLGYMEQGGMEVPFDQAMFGLNVGDVSEPVQTSFGFHIIQLNDIRGSQGKTFDEVRQQVRDAYLQSEAERFYYDYVEKLANETFKNQDSLEPAAEALGLTVRDGGWIGRDGGPGLFSSPKVTNAAFSEDVLVQGLNSELIELGDEQVMVLRVTDHKEASLLPLESVSEGISKALRREKAAARAAEHGKDLIARLQGGETLQAVAAAEAKQLAKPGSISRDDTVVPQPVRESLFRLPRPAGEEPVFGDAVLDNGNFVVIALRSVTDGAMEDADLAARRNMRNIMQSSLGESYLQHFVDNERDAATIVVSKKED